MATIPSNFNFPSAAQNPDRSIMDINGRQTYLGNTFVLPLNGATVNADGSGDEEPISLITNPLGNKKTIFIFQETASATDACIVRYYGAPTVTGFGTQTVALVADSGGSLNDTYFLLSSLDNEFQYYVWFDINSAGTDPAVPGLTGVRVNAATNASAATIGGAMVTAINAMIDPPFHATGTSTVTLVSTVTGGFLPAKDGPSGHATGFTFTVTGGLGEPTTPVSLRPANGNTSTAECYLSPVPTSNGTFLLSLLSNIISVNSTTMYVLDPGQTLLITAQLLNAGDGVQELFNTTVWFEI